MNARYRTWLGAGLVLTLAACMGDERTPEAADEPFVPLAVAGEHTGTAVDLQDPALIDAQFVNVGNTALLVTEFPDVAEGTGNFEPFLQVQATPFEAGYNTDECGEFDEKSCNQWTKWIPLNAFPLVTLGGPGALPGEPTGEYRYMRLDVNEAKNENPSPISVNVLEVYISEDGTVGTNNSPGCEFNNDGTPSCDFAPGGVPGAQSGLVWDLDDPDDRYLLMDYGLFGGSGVGDLAIYILNDDFEQAFKDVAGEDVDLANECPYDPRSEKDAKVSNNDRPGSLNDCGFYVYVASTFGHSEGANGDPGQDQNTKSEAGFEEYSVPELPFLVMDKDATPEFVRTHMWDIEKYVCDADDTNETCIAEADDPTDLHEVVLPTGSSDEVKWLVELSYDGAQDTDFEASGNITITYPGNGGGGNSGGAIVTSIEDVLSYGITSTAPDVLSCSVDGTGLTLPDDLPVELGAGDEIICSWSHDFGDADPGEVTNEISASLEDGGTTSASVTFDFDPSNDGDNPDNVGDTDVTEIDEDVTVDDLLDDEENFPDNVSAPNDGSWSYTITYTCDDDEGQHDNTATVNSQEPGNALLDSDDAQLTVKCFALSVNKDATPAFDREFEWTIDKSVDPDVWNLFDGESGASEYTIELVKSDPIDSNHRVSGSITVANDDPDAVEIQVDAVDDIITPGDIEAAVSCEDENGDTEAPWTLSPDEVLTCSYSADLPNADTRTNNATATTGSTTWPVDGPATAPIDFTGVEPTNVMFDEISVDDTNDEGDAGPFSSSNTYTYELTFTCGDGEGEYTGTGNVHDNTASTVGLDPELTSSASVEINCYDLDVTKDADEDFDRDWDWTIEKDFSQDFLSTTSNLDCTEPDADGDRVCTASLGASELFTVEYTVTVDASFNDNNWQVSDGITITNNHPTRVAVINDVVDEISNYLGEITVDCGVSFPYEIAEDGGTLECTYDTGAVDREDDNPFDGETNTATATQQLFDFPFGLDPVADPEHTKDYEGTALISFGDIPTNETDRCADVDDVLSGFDPLDLDGTDIETGDFALCGDEATFPKTYTYTREFESPEACDQTFINTATVNPQDSDPLSDSETLEIECEFGCTLTQGYYKTHGSAGPAPFDDILWGYVGGIPDFTYPSPPYDVVLAGHPIGDFDADGNLLVDGGAEYENEDLFDSGHTWYYWFHTPPSGGNDWIKLSHQWMAAYINHVANDGSPVLNYILDGAELLDAYDSDQQIPDGATGSITGETAGQIHSALASYNEGNAGVPHCTENGLEFLYRIYGPPPPA